MNQFIKAIKNLNIASIRALIQKDAKWLTHAEADGKNALHYLGGVIVNDDPRKAIVSLDILKLLLANGMDKDSIHQIRDGNCVFPATPLWYAYTRGRNELLYTFLLKIGADPEHCMFAIAWYDDAKAAALFKKHGATVDDNSIGETPFIAAFNWRRFEVAEWFLKNGADVNSTDQKGNTALYYAVKRRYKPEQIQLLLRYGANPDITNLEGISPRKLAETNRQQKILGLMNSPVHQ